ncbi:nucleoside transmembrane transporter FUN26 [Sugiyamaella lignohabitans]|uniref:Nucleoside transmembrane transporter FUN26 n=1 Tax=Sugiyamaella lignohabitans TaxID=796027 RepID=A0A167ESN1_9ASCO|nr:nucleoside transmembrane transporter FUN26 [Sugiyamaella lignohabitans]ANB14408.1 nucleoside transmembrane transporter FUN26 [Sugiyamaella lignohabitans]
MPEDNEDNEAVYLLNEEGDVPPNLIGTNSPPSISNLDYVAYATIGASYLWPWNCLLSATPYFQGRFEGYKFLQANFSSFVMSITTVTGTLFTILLADRQKNADYSWRVRVGELTIASVFLLLAFSCALSIPAVPYFLFILLCVFSSSIGTGLTQNGSYAIGNTLTSSHTQAITVGQAVSGVLPPIISMLSAIGSGASKEHSNDVNESLDVRESGSSSTNSSVGSALYFLAATAVCTAAIICFRQSEKYRKSNASGFSFSNENPAPEPLSATKKQHIPLSTLFSKLFVPASTVFITFAITLIYPVFAGTVKSSNGIPTQFFIPAVYLFWNSGDLLGRVLCGRPQFVVKDRRALTGYAVARLLFVPAFFLTNINGDGIIQSDVYYLLLQFAFGVTNGQLVTSALMESPSFVNENEKEAAGGFMTMSLSIGLAVGSLLSFVLVWILG